MMPSGGEPRRAIGVSFQDCRLAFADVIPLSKRQISARTMASIVTFCSVAAIACLHVILHDGDKRI